MKNENEKRGLKWWAKPLVLIAILGFVGFGWKGIPFLEERAKESGIFQTQETTEEGQMTDTEGSGKKEDQYEVEQSSNNKTDSKEPPLSTGVVQIGNASNVGNASGEESPIKVRGYANSFAGYTAMIVANGGLDTQQGSYYSENGLDVSIKIEDEDDAIIEAFKNGEIDFFFMTVNKMSLVCKELLDANKEVIIPYITDTSTGGDGIVANADYGSIQSLQNAKIGMARNSVSEAMLLWLFNVQSNIDVNTVINNFALYDSTQEAVDAFVRGDVSAVATWDLTSALMAEESHLLFSSKDAEYLIIDALVIDKEFAEENPEVVTKLIDGCIAVVNDINNNVNTNWIYDVIRKSIPDFSSYNDGIISELLNDSKQLGYNKNIEAFEIASGIYEDFCIVWNQIGFETNPEYANTLFDNSYINNLSSKWESKEKDVIEEEIVASEDVVDREALVSKTVNLLFEANSAEFLKGYEKEDEEMLDEFVKISKILNRMVIKIEGNVSLSPGSISTEFDYELSRLRAQHAKEYLVANGIEEQRIIIVANGGDKPIASNENAEGRRMNRNCIISFYQGETEAEQ